jgi:hypothetical protein
MTSTARYHHDPRYYRVTGRTVEHHLAAIADMLDQPHPHDLALRLDDLTDVVLVVERMAEAILARYGAEVIA